HKARARSSARPVRRGTGGPGAIAACEAARLSSLCFDPLYRNDSANGKGISGMKITSARVIVTCPGRNFVTLKIETDEGLTGIGDATLNGRELAVASYLTGHVIPCLIGMDPQRIEDVWQYLYRGAYWRRGPVTMSAIAAVDTALWDIKGKLAGMPLYQLLGGRSRDRVLVYGH